MTTPPGPHPLPRLAVREMPAYRPPLEGRRGLLRLDFNERTIGAPRAALEAIARLDPEAVAAYPEYGPYVTRLARRLGVAADQVLPTNATDEAIQVAVQTYVDAGDEVVLPSPTFAMFAVYARVAGAILVEVPFRREPAPDGARLAVDEEAYLAALARPRVRLAVLVDPNNPTATPLPPGFVERACAARPDVPVLVDEAYGAFVGRTAIGLVPRHPNLLVSQTFSKAHGLAGLRIGHLVSQAANIAALAKVRSPYSVNVAALAAAAALLDLPPEGEPATFVAQALEGRRRLVDGLRAMGVPLLGEDANFALARLGADLEPVLARLREAGILVRDRSRDRGLAGCVRATAGTPEQVERLLGALGAALDERRRGRALLFDLDGTLVDVSASYDECDRQTAEHFLRLAGIRTSVWREEVRRLRGEGGGTNDDWALTARLIDRKAREATGRGLQVAMDELVAEYQRRYLGEDGRPGLAATERFVAPPGLIERLARRFRLGVVTGRPRGEAATALGLAGAPPRDLWEVVVAREDCAPRLKPDPHGIVCALRGLGAEPARSTYVGDSRDDAAAALAAGVRFIDVATLGSLASLEECLP